ncbi:hypothetical protein D3C84_962940 [compost metagenome]
MLRCELFEQQRAEGVDHHRRRQVDRAGGDFLEQHDHGRPVEAQAAVGFTDRARDHAELGELAHDLGHLLAGDESVAIFLVKDRIDLVGQEATEAFYGFALFRGSDDVSHGVLLGSSAFWLSVGPGC